MWKAEKTAEGSFIFGIHVDYMHDQVYKKKLLEKTAILSFILYIFQKRELQDYFQLTSLVLSTVKSSLPSLG